MASFEIRGNSIRGVVRLADGKKKTGTFDTMAEYERWAADAEEKKRLGTLRGVHSGVTAGQLFEAYLESVASKTDTAKWNRLRLTKWLDDELAAKRLSAIVTHDINQWIERRGKDVSASTVNRELNLMSSAFNYALRDREWIKVNPCHGARRPERGLPRKRAPLSGQEVEALRISTGYDADPQLLTLTARVGACFLLALETGMRSGEILRLRPKDYWKAKRTAHVAAIETGGRKGARSGRASVDPSRNVPLTPRAAELLEQLLLNVPKDQAPAPGFTRPPYIVGINDGQRDALWRKARDQAGVEDLHFHDMKHEAATRMAKFLDVLALSHALGTKDVRLLRDTYYNNDASRSAARLPESLSAMPL